LSEHKLIDQNIVQP